MDDIERVLKIKGVEDADLIVEIYKKKFNLNFSRRLPEPAVKVYPYVLDPGVHLILGIVDEYASDRTLWKYDRPFEVITHALINDYHDTYVSMKLVVLDGVIRPNPSKWDPVLIEIIERIIKVSDTEMKFILEESKVLYDACLDRTTNTRQALQVYIDFMVRCILLYVPAPRTNIDQCVLIEYKKYAGAGEDADAEEDAGDVDSMRLQTGVVVTDHMVCRLIEVIGLFLGIRGDAVVERLMYGDPRVIDAVRGITGPITTTRGQPVPMAVFATRCQRAIDT